MSVITFRPRKRPSREHLLTGEQTPMNTPEIEPKNVDAVSASNAVLGDRDMGYDDCDEQPDRTCPVCGGDGMEDDITPCEHCGGEGDEWWL